MDGLGEVITNATFGPPGTVEEPYEVPQTREEGWARLELGPRVYLLLIPDILDWSDAAIQTLAYLGQTVADSNTSNEGIQPPADGWGVFDALAEWVEGQADDNGVIDLPESVTDALYLARNVWLDIVGVPRVEHIDEIRLPGSRPSRRREPIHPKYTEKDHSLAEELRTALKAAKDPPGSREAIRILDEEIREATRDLEEKDRDRRDYIEGTTLWREAMPDVYTTGLAEHESKVGAAMDALADLLTKKKAFE